MSKNKELSYELVLDAFDKGYLCKECEYKISDGTYYNDTRKLCKECSIYEWHLEEKED